MKRSCSSSFLVLILCMMVSRLLVAQPASPERIQVKSRNQRLDSDVETGLWQIRASLKYDAICLLNVLSGDPYYLQEYQADFDHFNPLLTAHERTAFVELKRIIKDENKGIISAFLALYLSAGDGEGLEGTIKTLQDERGLKQRLQKTSYFNDEDWRTYLKARPYAIRAIKALQRINFGGYWAETTRPKVEGRIRSLSKEIEKVRLLPTVERVLGKQVNATDITIYLLNYSKPHGIRITGVRFLTSHEYPTKIILANAVHEMLHPPYDVKRNEQLNVLLQSLKGDSYLMQRVNHHNPSFGYNDFAGFVEEDCVQALEQQIKDSLNFNSDQRSYWKQQDEGMHVLAVALFSLMSKQRFMESGETFSSFLERNLKEGKLGNGQIETLNREFFQSANNSQVNK